MALLALWTWLRRRRVRTLAGGDRGAAAGSSVDDEVSDRAGYADRIRSGLAKSRAAISGRIADVLGRHLDRTETLEAIEQILIESDVGVRSTQRLLDAVRKLPAGDSTADAVRAALQAEIRDLVTAEPQPADLPERPWVVLIVGVNGVGKTTTIGKLAALHRALGRSVLMVAGDTFRAAAIDQLAVWAERTGAAIVKQEPGSDPASVVFDGVTAAVARGVDVVLVDTAGRLHTRVNLMEELKKVRRVVERVRPGAPHEVLLVLDSTTGQNAISQARTFTESVGVTGVVLTKLDGSARGGVAIAIRHEVGLPVRFVGLGEGVGDLQPFDPETYAAGLFSGD